MKTLQIPVWVGVAIFWASSLSADTVELTNGDVLNGQVIALDGVLLTLKSDVLGELKIERKQVAAIHLGDGFVARKAAQPATPATAQPAVTKANTELQNVLNSVPSTDDVLKQLQGGGVNAQMIGELQTKFPLLNTPEAGDYFNDTLTGLMTGRMNIQDVRKDAVTARDELKKLQDELGPDGQALNGYLSILNKFIRETETEPADPKPAVAPKTPAQFPPKK